MLSSSTARVFFKSARQRGIGKLCIKNLNNHRCLHHLAALTLTLAVILQHYQTYSTKMWIIVSQEYYLYLRPVEWRVFAPDSLQWNSFQSIMSIFICLIKWAIHSASCSAFSLSEHMREFCSATAKLKMSVWWVFISHSIKSLSFKQTEVSAVPTIRTLVREVRV